MTLFRDRHDAGRQLGTIVARDFLRDPIVLGLPRGGVPVAYEVALALDAPLDVFVVRKLGVPRHEQLAMGAIATGGVRVLIPDVVADVPADVLEAVTAAERIELARREREYRGSRPFPHVEDCAVVLIDDGVATGASMIAAIQAVRALKPARVVAAAPVLSPLARASILRYADACEAVAVPVHFHNVGAWYHDFSQTTDEEVRALLHEAHSRPAPLRPSHRAVDGRWTPV